MTHGIKPKIIHQHQWNQKIKSDFTPAFLHWRYPPLYWGKSQIGPFPAKFKEKMPKKDEASSHAGCTHGHEIKMKKMKIPQENAKIKKFFRRRSPLGDFSPKLPKLAFSPYFWVKMIPTKVWRPPGKNDATQNDCQVSLHDNWYDHQGR